MSHHCHAVATEKAPAAVGPYSQAVKCGNLVFCSGQLPTDPRTGAFVGSTIEERTHQVLKNLSAVLEAAGSGLAHVVKTTVFLTDMGNFTAMNAVYATYFTAPAPARSTVQVAALPKGADIEIEAVAVIP